MGGRGRPPLHDPFLTGNPAIFAGAVDRAQPSFTLKHSITVTDYTVHVWRSAVPAEVSGRWIATGQLRQVALTGLARKILRKAGVIASKEPKLVD